MKSPITTHILDTHLGKPASAVSVALYRLEGSDYQKIASGETNEDGRITDWMSETQRKSGTYRVVFEIQAYFDRQDIRCLYPSITIDFNLDHEDEHYHIPLLVSANGYSTYRGS